MTETKTTTKMRINAQVPETETSRSGEQVCSICDHQDPKGIHCDTCGMWICESCFQLGDEGSDQIRCSQCLVENGLRHTELKPKTTKSNPKPFQLSPTTIRCGTCGVFRQRVVATLDGNYNCAGCHTSIGHGSFVRQCPNCGDTLNNRCFACDEPGCPDPISIANTYQLFSDCSGCGSVIVSCCAHRSRLLACVSCANGREHDGSKHLCPQCIVGCYYCATPIGCRQCNGSGPWSSDRWTSEFERIPRQVCLPCRNRFSSALESMFSSRDLVRIMMEAVLS